MIKDVLLILLIYILPLLEAIINKSLIRYIDTEEIKNYNLRGNRMRPKAMEKELNLSDYISIIKKRKITVLVTIFVTLTISATIIQAKPKIYRASTTITILPSVVYSSSLRMKFESLRAKELIIFHRTFLESKEVLEKVLSSRLLNEDIKKDLGISDLSKKINIKTKRASNDLILEVSAKSNLAAENIANTWAKEYINYRNQAYAKALKNIELAVHTKKLSDLSADLKETMFTLKAKTAVLKELKEEIKNSDSPAYLEVALINTLSELDEFKARTEFLKSMQEEIIKEINGLRGIKTAAEPIALGQENISLASLALLDELKLGRIKIISDAMKPKHYFETSKITVLFCAAIIGFIFGVLFAMLKESPQKINS